jgi:hypothetical protein
LQLQQFELDVLKIFKLAYFLLFTKISVKAPVTLIHVSHHCVERKNIYCTFGRRWSQGGRHTLFIAEKGKFLRVCLHPGSATHQTG